MLSSVLRSQTAIQVNIRIMRAFNAMRRFVASNMHTIAFYVLTKRFTTSDPASKTLAKSGSPSTAWSGQPPS